MDFMNLNQSAHGDREYGFICTRMGKARKVIVGYWQDDEVIEQLAIWTRAALAWDDLQGAKLARFGDNMREVAVTEGDKVGAQIKLGFSVNGYGLGDLVKYLEAVKEARSRRYSPNTKPNINYSRNLDPVAPKGGFAGRSGQD